MGAASSTPDAAGARPATRSATSQTNIRNIFCDACDLMGLRWTAAGEKTIYVSRKADVATLDRFVGPGTMGLRSVLDARWSAAAHQAADRCHQLFGPFFLLRGG